MIYSINKPFEDKKELLLINAVANTNESLGHCDKIPNLMQTPMLVKLPVLQFPRPCVFCGNFLDIETKIMPLLSQITTPCRVYLGSLSNSLIISYIIGARGHIIIIFPNATRFFFFFLLFILYVCTNYQRVSPTTLK